MAELTEEIEIEDATSWAPSVVYHDEQGLYRLLPYDKDVLNILMTSILACFIKVQFSRRFHQFLIEKQYRRFVRVVLL